MANKLRYGPRFRSPTRDVSYVYDERVANGMTPPPHIRHCSPERRFWGNVKHSATVHNKFKGISLAKVTDTQPAIIDEAAVAMDGLNARLRKCVEIIAWGIQECIDAEVYGNNTRSGRAPHQNLIGVIELVQRVAHFAGMEAPEFAMSRKQGAVSSRVCLDCGCALPPGAGELCDDCRADANPNESAIRAASEARRERDRALQEKVREAKALRKSINALEKRLK